MTIENAIHLIHILAFFLVYQSFESASLVSSTVKVVGWLQHFKTARQLAQEEWKWVHHYIEFEVLTAIENRKRQGDDVTAITAKSVPIEWPFVRDRMTESSHPHWLWVFHVNASNYSQNPVTHSASWTITLAVHISKCKRRIGHEQQRQICWFKRLQITFATSYTYFMFRLFFDIDFFSV